MKTSPKIIELNETDKQILEKNNVIINNGIFKVKDNVMVKNLL
jgi:hypothetical protein